MKIQLLLHMVVIVGLLSCTSTKSPEEVADVIYTKGKIYTVNEAQPWAEAVAIKNRKFLKVGSSDDIGELAGEETKVIDLDGKFVMPGIVDMHAHPFTGVDMGIGGLFLGSPGNPEEIINDIKSYVQANHEKDVILGGNWNVGGTFKNDSPDKNILDEIAPDVPIFLLSQSGHSAWVNSKALELAGINKNYQNEGAYIFDRYQGTNEPSGTARDVGMAQIMSARGKQI